MTSLPDLHGVCPPRFNAVKDAFAANFTDAPEGLNELAARFSVTIDGAVAVDLWAGSADLAGTKPFAEDTLVPVFSTGKAVMALLMATAVEAGQVDYDQTVASLWPAFGAVAFAGILSTGVAFTLQVVGQRHAKASIAAMIMALESLWGAVGGALFLGERFTLTGLVGAGLMMAGILLAQVPTRAERAGEGLVPVPEPPSTALRDE